MSYAAFHAFGCAGRDCTGCACQKKGLGAFVPWRQVQVETDEAYVWRGFVTGVKIAPPPDGISDVKLIALALGAASTGMGIRDPTGLTGPGLLFTMRGVTIKPISEDSFMLDGVFTSSQSDLLFGGTVVSDAGDVGDDLQAKLQSTWPSAHVSGEEFWVINDETPLHPALDFWRSRPAIWDPQLGQGKAPFFLRPGGPTAALDRFEGLYRGTAEQGIALKPWPRTGAAKNGKKNGKKNGNGKSPPEGAASVLLPLLVIGGVAVAYILVDRTAGAKEGAKA